MIPVTTRSYDNQRTGANLHETTLTPDAVRTRGMRKWYSFFLEGDARGTEGMTLIAPSISCSDGLNHDIAFVATMANNVYGFDANTGGMMWQRRIANPIKGVRSADMYLINDHWGILSTPVLDVDRGLAYVVAMDSHDGTLGNAEFRFHGIRLRDGSEAFPSISLEGATYDPGHGLPAQKFATAARKQRCGLTMTYIGGTKTVFVAAGSFYESAATNRGWVIAIDVTQDQPRVAAAWAATAKDSGGGIWQGGQGLAADDVGHLYGMTGNGAFDGITDFGNCFFKLQYTPARQGNPASLRCVDWFSPFTDAGLLGYDPTLASVSLIGREKPTDTPSNTNNAEDMDLGSGGPVLITKAASGLSKNIIVGAGKHGIAYVVDADNMGRTQLADMAQDRIAEHVYGALLSAPIWFTDYNPAVNPATNVLADLSPLHQGKTRHQHSTPVFYRSALHGPMVFCWGENSALRAWAIRPDFSLQYLACSAETASPWCGVPGGMPGGMISLTANRDQSPILWACVPLGDANKTISPGRLLAYDPDNFVPFPDGTMQLPVLFDTLRNATPFVYNKFNVPVGWNGKVFAPEYNDSVSIWGLG